MLETEHQPVILSINPLRILHHDARQSVFSCDFDDISDMSIEMSEDDTSLKHSNFHHFPAFVREKIGGVGFPPPDYTSLFHRVKPKSDLFEH